MAKEKQIQEDQYSFPYHFLPSLDRGGFSQTKTLRWGYEYLSYLRFILNKLGSKEFSSLADVGCGDGRFLAEATKRFPEKRFTGIDISERAIAYAKAFNPMPEYFCGDISSRYFTSRGFDIITLIETLEHIEPTKIPDFLLGVHKHLRSGGLLLLTVPTTNIKRNPKHYQHFTIESLSGTLAPNFKITEHHYLNKHSLSLRIFDSILANRFAILNQRQMLDSFYHMYERRYLNASEGDASRIFVIAEKL